LELLKEIGAYAGLVAFLGLAVLALLSFAQGRDIRRLREWAGSAPERDNERKEATSAAAQERAEEMRKLEEAREAERNATEQREQRRERREAGLPEMTRSERLRERFGRHEAPAGGIGSRLGEPRYLATIFVALILVAGVVVFAVSQSGDSGGGGGKAVKRTSQALKPSEIEVAVLNGTAVDGLAGSYGDMVERRGEFATGVLYVEPDKEDFISLLGLVDEPLASLPLERVRPPKTVLDEVMESLR